MEITKVRELISERNKKVPEKLELKSVLKHVLSFLGGFLLMNPFILNQLSPFAISLTAASNGTCSFASAAGAIIGALVFFDGTMAVKYIAILLLCVLINGLCSRYLDGKILKMSIYANAFASTLITSTAIMLATGFELEEFVTILAEAALCLAGTFVYKRGAEIAWGGKDFSKLTESDVIVILAGFGAILAPFAKYTVAGFSPITFAFAIIILICGRLKNELGGATAGICLGTIAGLSGDFSFLSVGYALGGLLCGETARKSRILSAVSFSVTIGVTAIIDTSVKAYIAIAECVVASVIYILIPERFFVRMSGRVNIPVPVYIKSLSNEALTKRLNDASSAIEQISNCVDTVQKALTPITYTQLSRTVKSTWCKVCSRCDLYESCRNEIKNPDDEAYDKIARALSDNVSLDNTKLPKDFDTACYCYKEMCSALHNSYLNFVAGLGSQGKICQIQGLMSDQFKSMADILRDIACEFDEDMNANSETADICANEAREHGLNVLNSGSYLDKFGRIFISLNVVRPHSDFNITKLTDGLSNALGTKLDLPTLSEDGDECTFDFCQLKSLIVDSYAYSRSIDDEQICGDYYHSYTDANGRFISILSDGMGTGSRAAVDSAMAAELFSKLLKSGLSFDCALPIANSALLVKSDDESLATLDILCVDLYTGRTDFMKAGAAATFIRHKGSVATLEQASLPIGILRDIAFSKATAKLESGDIILMVSDGVLGEHNGWIQQELKVWDKGSPSEMAHFIVNSACERRLGKHRDDMTAIAVFIK